MNRKMPDKKQIQKWQQQEKARTDGHVANNLEQAGWVKDRKTGEWYDPKERFAAVMNSPEVQAQFKRMKDR